MISLSRIVVVVVVGGGGVVVVVLWWWWPFCFGAATFEDYDRRSDH